MAWQPVVDTTKLMQMAGAIQLLIERNLQEQSNTKELNDGLVILKANVLELRNQGDRNTALIRQLIYQRDAALASEQAAIAGLEAAQAKQGAAEAERDMWKNRYDIVDEENGQLEKKCAQQKLDLCDLYYRLLDAELACQQIGQ